MESPYGGDFHVSRDAETRYSAEKILSIALRDSPQVQSAIDVGCGVGTFLDVARGLGVGEVFGMDGEWVDPALLVIPLGDFQAVDLRSLPQLERTFDLGICLEVAEHLPPENAAGFVRFLCSVTDRVLFSAAVPKQGGIGHENEAWQSYWAALFGQHGFAPTDSIRPEIWNDEKVPFWYRQNILIYSKTTEVPSERFRSMALDLIHPELYALKIKRPVR